MTSERGKHWWMDAEDAGAPERARAAPDDAPERDVSRRGFLQRVGFGAAVAATACSSPRRQALPFVEQPETVTPGASSHYASLCGGCASACGLMIEARDGRPIKVEGNPDHPVSRGGVCALGQAAPLSLYDSGRPSRPTIDGDRVGWSRFDARVREAIEAASEQGERVVLLTGEGPRSSPTTRALIGSFSERTGAEHVAFAPLSRRAIAEAHLVSHGRRAGPAYRFESAQRVVSLGADFLGTWGETVAQSRGWAEARRPDRHRGRMSRVVQLEGRMSLTGSNADERIRVAPSERWGITAALARRLADRAEAADHRAFVAALRDAPAPALDEATLDRLANDLWEARGQALVVSEATDVREQLVVNRMNELLDAYGATVDLDSAPEAAAEIEDLSELIADMRGGRVGVLIVWGANPAYASAQAAAFRSALGSVRTTVAITDRRTETAAASRFVAPETHFLESWSDAQPRRGVVAVRQPTFRPLDAQQPGQLRLMRWMGDRSEWLDRLRASWARNVFPQSGQLLFTSFWDRAVHDGVAEIEVPRWVAPDGSEPRYGERQVARVAPEEAAPVAAAVAVAAAAGTGTGAGAGAGAGAGTGAGAGAGTGASAGVAEVERLRTSPGSLPQPLPQAGGEPGSFDAERVIAALGESPAGSPGDGEYELVAHADLSVGDGHEANNPWLQEAPDPITKVSWDNHLSVSRAVADGLGLELGDVVEVSDGDRSIEAPVVIQPGQHDRVVSIALGYGRSEAGDVADGVGVDAWPLARSSGVSLRKTGERVRLALSQTHMSAEGRPIVREASFAEYQQNPGAGNGSAHHGLPLWRPHRRPGRRWGMTIDLNACTGCNACLVSCQVENNVPVVGRDEVRNRREMHWIRLDRYYAGDESNPDVAFQPMLCQHCDDAPCETVCPVLATVQSSEGLNQQVYNRCVGTRYCANNCPYKVRRFNWFDYARDDATQNLALNPDVVVRTRGVMEKCSFCVQRIQAARWTARREGRELRDGDVQTACQQSCPTQAIAFGDLNDADSEVSRRRGDPRTYRVLAELHVEPVVHYQTRIRNREEEA